MTRFTVLIPARYASTRLPGKPLADIGGAPMVVQVARRAQQSGASRVVIATDDTRVADAAASPYLALAVLIQAGLDGVRRELPLETQNPAALPTSLAEALTLLERSAAAADWLGEDLLSAYLLFKRAEIKGLEGLDESEICRRYAEVY